MTRFALDSTARLRLLECWLPLVAELNDAEMWKYPSQALPALVVKAAPFLERAENAAMASKILRNYRTDAPIARRLLQQHPQSWERVLKAAADLGGQPISAAVEAELRRLVVEAVRWHTYKESLDARLCLILRAVGGQP